MATQVTIVNPNPGGITVTLNRTELPGIDGAAGGTSFNSLAAELEPQNTLVVWYGMSRTWSYDIALDDGLDGLQLFLFLGVAILIELSIGQVVAQVQGTSVGDEAATQ
jgi:hypothetical protein